MMTFGVNIYIYSYTFQTSCLIYILLYNCDPLSMTVLYMPFNHLHVQDHPTIWGRETAKLLYYLHYCQTYVELNISHSTDTKVVEILSKCLPVMLLHVLLTEVCCITAVSYFIVGNNKFEQKCTGNSCHQILGFDTTGQMIHKMKISVFYLNQIVKPHNHRVSSM